MRWHLADVTPPRPCSENASMTRKNLGQPRRRTFSTKSAPSVVRCHAQNSVAIGGGADMDDRAAMADSDANDPKPTSLKGGPNSV